MFLKEKPPPNPFGDVLGGTLYLLVAVFSVVLVPSQSSFPATMVLVVTAAVAIYESVKCFARALENS